ncbi:ATP-binding protein [Ottowia sp. SB7-C50]|uniref:hybrid sensor histidine kinase/response regulator n=1 Tax=Ottowia sp. SB7-C50 TaxID=3081231 RepID=UPI0029533172|nr:ATP-binding protein [Ottowia sp. SB7-C50]WOP15433.1 ATP-binding protein [Ottowia sp. SB7-C50]
MSNQATKVERQDDIARQFPFLAGDDAASRQVRAIDWAATPLGPIAGWPAPLRILLGTLLKSRNPMLLYWGPQLIHFYNAAFIPSLDARQFPGSMGQPGEQAWSDIWPVIGPKLRAVMDGQGATWDEDQLIPGLRHGRVVDVFWTYSFTPVSDEQGRIGGVLVAATETTARMVAARRQTALHGVSDALARQDAMTEDLFASTLQALVSTRIDAPCVTYLRWARPEDAPLCMGHFPAGDDPWPPAEQARALQGRADRFDMLARGEPVLLPGLLSWRSPDYDEPVTDVLLLPLRHAGEAELQCIAFGLNPRVPLGDGYQRFLQSLTDELSFAIQRGETAQARQRDFDERDNLLRNAPMAIAVLSGPDQTFTLVNPHYCRITGRSEERLLGNTYVGAFPELADTPWPTIAKNVYLTGERYVSPETMIPLDFGRGRLEERYFQFNLEPMRDVSQRITGLTALAQDVTEQVLARTTLERNAAERQLLLERAQQAARGKDEFMAMLGHELRNPLAPIVSALHIMQRTGGAFERERAVIERQVRHLTRLVDDLMDVARIARGRIRLEPSLTRPVVLVQRAAEMVMPLMEQRGHQLEVVPPERPIVWWGDADRLVQVVSNLLTNAARYTPHGGRVVASVRRDTDAARGRDDVVIEVADNGIGIPPEQLEGIFDEFYQVTRQASDRAHGGLGLGLALVKSLVQLHGGQVAAFSEGKGKGSRFVVRLPLRDQPVTALPAAEPRQAARQSLRVLLVDDNRDAVELMAHALSLQGHQVRVAYTPEEALDLAERSPPQVAVLDVGLPGMDGKELARLLRARLGDSCLLVALSGYGQDNDRAYAKEAGFAHYLVKPATVEQLQAVLMGAVQPAGE